jgi:hypothetical protein
VVSELVPPLDDVVGVDGAGAGAESRGTAVSPVVDPGRSLRLCAPAGSLTIKAKAVTARATGNGKRGSVIRPPMSHAIAE